MTKKRVKVKCEVDPLVNLCCINANCVNLVVNQFCCNLKNVIIDNKGKCSGFVKIKIKHEKSKSPKQNRSTGNGRSSVMGNQAATV